MEIKHAVVYPNSCPLLKVTSIQNYEILIKLRSENFTLGTQWCTWISCVCERIQMCFKREYWRNKTVHAL